jgi:hypothetical protein
MPKMILKARMEGGRKRGRLRKRWLEDAERDLQQLGVRNWRLKAWSGVEDCSEGSQGQTWTVVLVMM